MRVITAWNPLVWRVDGKNNLEVSFRNVNIREKTYCEKTVQ